MSMPEWAVQIRRLLMQLGYSQEELSRRLGVSPATLSRWVNGKNEPPADRYVALGNLAGHADGMYFWERAGIERFGATGDGGGRGPGSTMAAVSDLDIVANKRLAELPKDEKLVAIPLLNAPVYADESVPLQPVSLATAKVEDVLTAPEDWCPHPTSTIALRVHGDSMFPTIPPGAIVMLDTASRERDALDRKIVVVSHRDAGLKIARLQKLGDAVLMVSANHRIMPVDISNRNKWKVMGEVLWWISRDEA